MCYTEHYWDNLCKNILKSPLHHGPTKGGIEEGAKFSDWYSKTLDSYREIFKEKPPKDIWPSPRKRFRVQNFRRIDCKKHFIISKRDVGFLLLGFVATCLLTGDKSNFVNSIGSGVLWVTGLVVVISLITALGKSGKSGSNGGSSCGFFAGCGNSS